MASRCPLASLLLVARRQARVLSRAGRGPHLAPTGFNRRLRRPVPRHLPRDRPCTSACDWAPPSPQRGHEGWAPRRRHDVEGLAEYNMSYVLPASRLRYHARSTSRRRRLRRRHQWPRASGSLRSYDISLRNLPVSPAAVSVGTVVQWWLSRWSRSGHRAGRSRLRRGRHVADRPSATTTSAWSRRSSSARGSLRRRAARVLGRGFFVAAARARGRRSPQYRREIIGRVNAVQRPIWTARPWIQYEGSTRDARQSADGPPSADRYLTSYNFLGRTRFGAVSGARRGRPPLTGEAPAPALPSGATARLTRSGRVAYGLSLFSSFPAPPPSPAPRPRSWRPGGHCRR